MFAERAITSGLRHEFIWRMNEETARELASAFGLGLPPDEPLPTGMQMFGMRVEIVEASEILLAMKVA